jgi:serine/threonine-protein kinase
MAVTATVVTHYQYAAMMGQMTDYGGSLSRFIASQSAVPMLSEDWIALDVFVQEVMKSQDFQGITVVDRTGTVRAGSGALQAGMHYVKTVGESLGTEAGLVAVQRISVKGEDVMEFDSPITFQGKLIGHVVLGLPEAPLRHVAHLSLVLMSLLVVTTIAAVAIATFLIANWFSKPISLLRESMTEIGGGHFTHRIGETRNDEFGLLYQSFDDMAQALQTTASGSQDLSEAQVHAPTVEA